MYIIFSLYNIHMICGQISSIFLLVLYFGFFTPHSFTSVYVSNYFTNSDILSLLVVSVPTHKLYCLGHHSNQFLCLSLPLSFPPFLLNPLLVLFSDVYDVCILSGFLYNVYLNIYFRIFSYRDCFKLSFSSPFGFIRKFFNLVHNF